MKQASDHERRIRVLYCILDSRFGGPHRLAQTAGRQLRAYGVETFFLLGQKSQDLWHPDGFEAVACRHIQCFMRRHCLRSFAAFCVWLPANLRTIRRLIRSHDIDIVHIDGITNFVPALAARLTRTPVVWHYNDHLPNPFKWLLLRLVKALAATVIVQGARLREARTGSDAKLAGKTVVLYPGIDLREFDPQRYDSPARARLREELGIPGDVPLVGMIGNMNRFKGHAYFIRAAQRIKEQVKTAKFVVVGRKLDTDPDYWEQMQQLVAECGLKEDLIFAGFREDAAAILSILDVFVLSSVLESCPNVVLEAMAMEVPVVATDVGAVSEMVLQGRTGFVAPPHDDAALAQGVLACLTMPKEQVRNMVTAARKRVENAFGADIMARQQYRVYERISEHTVSRSGPEKHEPGSR
jgi:glycosyltransferase involved in cell wall biosynthesis